MIHRQFGPITPGHSGTGSNDNDGVLHILQIYSITGVSPLDCSVSYLGHSLAGVLTLCRDAVGVFYTPSRLCNVFMRNWTYPLMFI